MANRLIGASLCLSDINAMAKAGHSAFVRAKNGKIYFNVTQWLNEEPDQYGNHTSYQLNSHKDKREEEKATYGKCYIGNGKYLEQSGPEPIASGAADVPEDGDLPF